jgi:hypothetical protein
MEKNNEYFTGLLEDNRPDQLKDKDFLAVEVIDLSGDDVAWREKDEDELKQYPIWSQNGSGACVAFAFSKAIAVEIYRKTKIWVDLSPAYFYQHRSNRHSAGMNTHNACEIANNIGTTLEALMPSQELTEEEINSVPKSDFAISVADAVAEAVGSYLYLPVDMDAVARVLDMGKAVPVTIFATRGEYRGKEVPVIRDKDLKIADAPIKHKVLITDYYVHPRYGKVFQVDDSWGYDAGKGGRRIFTEEWFKARCSGLVWFNKFEFDTDSVEKPAYNFKKTLQRVPVYTEDPEVVALQNCLKYEGVFPTDVASTGYFGRITEIAVKEFQAKYGIETVGIVGPITRAKLNSIFN